MSFGWDYPPGVTGNEYEINGAEDVRELKDETCPKCGHQAIGQELYQHETRMFCSDCDWLDEWREMEDDREADEY